MKKLWQALCPFSILLLISNLAFAAKVKLKDGSVIDGTVKGLIIQKGDVEKSQSEDDPTKPVYSALYRLTNGKEITLIDEQGVHKKGKMIVFIRVIQKDAPPDDLEVVETGISAGEGGVSMFHTKAGGTGARVSGLSSRSDHVNTEELLGSLLIDPVTKKYQIIPAIEILTNKETIKVPIKDIVEFKVSIERK